MGTMILKEDASHRFVSTKTASKMLGLSDTYIRKLVDRNELDALKTLGGHRRISLDSLEKYRDCCMGGKSRLLSMSKARKVMIVTEKLEWTDKIALSPAYQQNFDFKFENSMSAALLSFSQERPDLLIAELSGSIDEQVKTVNALSNFNSKNIPIPVVLYAGEVVRKELQVSDANRLVRVINGKFSEAWLHGFLLAISIYDNHN